MKKIVLLIIFIICTLPVLIQAIIWSFQYQNNPTEENMEKGTELIGQAAIPWWIIVMKWIGELG